MSPLMSPRATRGMAVLLGVVLLAGSALGALGSCGGDRAGAAQGGATVAPGVVPFLIDWRLLLQEPSARVPSVRAGSAHADRSHSRQRCRTVR